MDLYIERGFDQTTVAQIAQRAGLTERTFFRYFADKREVLFWGSATLQELLVETLEGLPPSLAPIDAVAGALDVIAHGFEERRVFALRRQSVIASNPELQERELIKLESLTVATAQALRSRGTSELVATLSAHAGIAVFKVAFEQWVKDDGQITLAKFITASFTELKSVSAGGS